jgi:hypothetical protein
VFFKSYNSYQWSFCTIALTGLKYVHMLHKYVIHIYCVLYDTELLTLVLLTVHIHLVPGGWNLLTLVTCM